MRSTRILSERHFKSLLKYSTHLTSLQHCVFLIHDTTLNTTYFTQFYKPGMRPKKVYFHGFDITRFLTHRSNLTNYSYFFLNYVYSIGFTLLDVRNYFKGFSKVTNYQPDSKKLLERGLRPLKDKPTFTKVLSSNDYAADESIPMQVNPVIRTMFDKMAAAPVTSPLDGLQMRKFDEASVFNTALKLSVCSIASFRFAESRVQLFMNLKRKGFNEDVLLLFRQYLESEIPRLVSNDGLFSLLSDLAMQYGWYPRGTKSTGEDALQYSILRGDLVKIHGRDFDLVEIMFRPADLFGSRVSVKYTL